MEARYITGVLHILLHRCNSKPAVVSSSSVYSMMLAFAVQDPHGSVRCELVRKVQPAVVKTIVYWYTGSCKPA